MLSTPAGMPHHAKPQMEHRIERDARLLPGKGGVRMQPSFPFYSHGRNAPRKVIFTW